MPQLPSYSPRRGNRGSYALNRRRQSARALPVIACILMVVAIVLSIIAL
jgi:hypothetical protein